MKNFLSPSRWGMTLTLRRSVLLLVLGLLVGSVTIIGGIAWITATSSIEALSRQLLEAKSQSVRARLASFFGEVPPALEYLERAVFAGAGQTPFEQWEHTGREIGYNLAVRPHLTWLYAGSATTGDLIGCLRTEDGTIILAHTHGQPDLMPATFELGEDGSWTAAESGEAPAGRYDSRTRPWFAAALQSGEIVWTPPYSFLGSRTRGVTAAQAVRDQDGRVTAVLAADLVLEELGQFLATLRVGQNGGAFLLLDDGSFLVDETIRETINPARLRLQKALEPQRFDLSSLAGSGYLERRAVQDGEVYRVRLEQVQLTGTGAYFAAVIVPEADFLGTVHRNAWAAGGASLLILGTAVALGLIFARRVTQPLEQISKELESIGNLRFPDTQRFFHSSIREIAQFNDSLGKMSLSLRSFSRYVPSDLVRVLLQRGDEAKLGGRVQHVTIQFTDLAGFTTLSETLAPDEVFAELREFLEIVARHERANGGITSNFTGDGTLALYNAPESLEGHSAAACRAALGCVAELERLNGVRRREGRPELRARIGINTAEVLLGNLGTRERFSYTAVGDGVNLASRLEGLNKLYGSSILVGDACRWSASESFVWRKVDCIAVLGRSRPVVIWEPLGQTGGVSPRRMLGRDLYERALENYFQGSFAEAQVLFAQVVSAFPHDGPAAVMLRRTEEFIRGRVDANWNGVFLAPSK
ncbi:MAG TPA: adenylate/guanylate cyclase domain-containing protein [Verrucomicrobiales bacterium]|nr:adenylate/guanylate cyclase domain-containing protein [Verrucomicrobiales bacterium]